MQFTATTKDGKPVLVSDVRSVTSVRGMLIVRWGNGQPPNSYNDNDLQFWELTSAS